ncbi:MAG: hypothetical protein PHU46_15835 [Rhodocyclaceae bacterium]|nr:hypothetical protein [Rhodocyclaceae bacterium]
MYPLHKTLPKSELEAAARRIPLLHLLPALSPNEELDVEWDDAGNLTVASGVTITERDFDEVADLA